MEPPPPVPPITHIVLLPRTGYSLQSEQVPLPVSFARGYAVVRSAVVVMAAVNGGCRRRREASEPGGVGFRRANNR